MRGEVMKKHICLSLALCSLLIAGAPAYAGHGTVTAIYVDIHCGGFVQFSDAPSIWVGVPQSATTSFNNSNNNSNNLNQSRVNSPGNNDPASPLAPSTASIIVWQALNNAFILANPVTYTLSGTYCGDHPALLDLSCDAVCRSTTIIGRQR
jgi:hypothetical protein